MSDLKLVELPTRRAECKASVKERLQEAVDQVDKGDVIAIGFALVNADGSITTGFSETDQIGAMMGSAFELLAKIQRAGT